MYRTRYLISHDLDEFVVPMIADTWRDMPDSIVGQNRGSVSNEIASFRFRNLFLSLHTTSDVQFVHSNVSYWHTHMLTLSKMFTDVRTYPWTVRSKMMARPEHILMWHVHLIYGSSLVVKGKVNYYVNVTDCLLFYTAKLMSR